MAVASSLSKSLVFYYSGAMAVGIFLVILMVLFQVTIQLQKYSHNVDIHTIVLDMCAKNLIFFDFKIV